MYAFISYQTEDKHIAGRIQHILDDAGIKSFLAHEDIKVSVEWRGKILEEIGKSTIFISLLSQNYYSSPWCIQESGIASYRKEMTAIPLSIDGSIPQGFAENIQSTEIDPDKVSLQDLLPGLIRHNFDFGVSLIINTIGESTSFRGAEANFRLILPYLDQLSDAQMIELLHKIIDNSQVHYAGQCANEYIPPLLKSHGHLLENNKREFLEGICEY